MGRRIYQVSPLSIETQIHVAEASVAQSAGYVQREERDLEFFRARSADPGAAVEITTTERQLAVSRRALADAEARLASLRVTATD